MPLIKRIARVEFEPNVYEDQDENLTMVVEVEGYPGWDDDGRRSTRTEGSWLLSEASFLLQERLPVELKYGVDTADLMDTGNSNEPSGQLWLYEGWAFSSDDQQGLAPEDVRALVNVESNKRRLALEKAHALQAMTDNYDKPKRRESIPQVVRMEVWQRDGGRCVECGSQERLEFDHIIPIAMGGGNTSRNLQLLCETCNRRKGATLG